MTTEEFKTSLNLSHPDPNWNVHLMALWYDAKGDWKNAHDLIDQLTDIRSAQIHAYLHRVEGDNWNANYWYNRAKQPQCKDTLQNEWERLLKIVLEG